jgi:hypothetical protein
MAKTKAQQAAIAISMKKAGKTPKSLPKAQTGKQVKGMYDYGNIWTGPDSTSPGVIKVKADKKKADANLLVYKKKVNAQKEAAIKKAQSKKKG